MKEPSRYKFLFLLLSLAISIANVLIDHLLAPFGLFFTPLLIILVTILVRITSDRFNIWTRVILIYILIALNDMGIKLFGGGIHDSEGQGFIQLFFFVGLIPSFIILLITVFKEKNLTIVNKIASAGLFVILIGLHLYVFRNTGMDRSYL